MKNNKEMVKYKKSIVEKFIDSIYLKMLKNKDIDKVFLKNSFLVKRCIVQECGIQYLCDNFDIKRLNNIWSKVSTNVKQEKFVSVKNALLNYIETNFEKFDEIINELPDEFSGIYKKKTNNREFLKDFEIINTKINVKAVNVNESTDANKENFDELRKALTEVKIILSGYSEEVINCIPVKFMSFIEENYDREYIPDINPLVNINRQKLLEKTKVLLAIIYKKYASSL